MPPRKRKQPPSRDHPVTGSPVPPEPTPVEEASSPAQASSSVAYEDDGDLPPFLNTTFSIHRVSPLYVGKQPLSQDRLRVLSQRLRDVLVGDVVRGVEIGMDRGADDGVMARAGALELVGIGWVNLESLLGRHIGGGEDSGGIDGSQGLDSDATGVAESLGRKKTLQISLQYENTHCTALLLPSLRRSCGDEDKAGESTESQKAQLCPASLLDENDPDFLQFPLLLLRMPAPLKTVVAEFLSRTFDCRVSALSLGTKTLVRSLERWIRDSGTPGKGQFARDTVITLGFYSPTVIQAIRKDNETASPSDEDDAMEQDQNIVGIRGIDLIIPAADLRRFVMAGQRLELEQNQALGNRSSKRETRDVYGPAKRRRLGGEKDEEGWMWRKSTSTTKSADTETRKDDTKTSRPQPFTEALARYVRHHLALDLFHPAVRITKIACGGFALSAGRVKILGAATVEEGFSDTHQRPIWGIMEGLMEKAQVVPLD